MAGLWIMEYREYVLEQSYSLSAILWQRMNRMNRVDQPHASGCDGSSDPFHIVREAAKKSAPPPPSNLVAIDTLDFLD